MTSYVDEKKAKHDDLQVNVEYDEMPELEDIPQAPTNERSKERKSGFTIKYELKDAGIKGKGIFTLEDIPYGTKVWGLVDGNHFIYKNESELRDRLKNCSNEECIFILNHIWGMDDNKIILECNDNAEYVNHSSTPNLVCGNNLSPPNDDNSSCWAGRDIKAGEELTDDYSLYGVPDWYIKLCKEYSVESSKDVHERVCEEEEQQPRANTYDEEKPYFKHLVDVDMNYTEHMFLSLKLSARMAWGSLTAFIHALYPDIFITSTSSTCDYLHNELQKRNHKQKRD
jgi:hypothetical protein